MHRTRPWMWQCLLWLYSGRKWADFLSFWIAPPLCLTFLSFSLLSPTLVFEAQSNEFAWNCLRTSTGKLLPGSFIICSIKEHRRRNVWPTDNSVSHSCECCFVCFYHSLLLYKVPWFLEVYQPRQLWLNCIVSTVPMYRRRAGPEMKGLKSGPGFQMALPAPRKLPHPTADLPMFSWPNLILSS